MEVKTLQQILYNEQLLNVTPTGYFGALTRAAVIEYQRENGLPTTGFVGPLTRARLLITQSSTNTMVSQTASSSPTFTRNLFYGSSSRDVKTLQQILFNEQLLNVTPTGYFGALTRAAVIEYQRENGLPTTGFVGPLTLSKLNAINIDQTGARSSGGSSGPITAAVCGLGALFNSTTGQHCAPVTTYSGNVSYNSGGSNVSTTQTPPVNNPSQAMSGNGSTGSSQPVTNQESAISTTPVLLTELRFSSTTLSAPGWIFGAQHGGAISVQPTSAPDSSTTVVDALVGSYPVPTGGNYIWANYNIASLDTEDIYIEFWAKMPGVKEGLKFLKIFGKRSATPPNYANTTIGTNYNGGDYGSIPQVGFGDGTGLINDTQNPINLNGNYPKWIGRSYGTASVQTPQMGSFSSADWGTSWHHFRVHIKFNSGTTAQNEVQNGQVYLEIDGKVYANATGLYNRNPANGPIQTIDFFGWAQTETKPFQVWYDDIRISTGGFL